MLQKAVSKAASVCERFSWFRTLEAEFAPSTIFSLFGGLFINIAMCCLDFAYSVYYSSPWYFTFALYYLLLFLSRGVSLLFCRHNIKKYKGDETMYACKSYRLHLFVACFVFALSLLIGGILYVVLRLTPPSTKSLIPAITSATYTFFKMFNAIRNLIKVKKSGQSVPLLTFKDIGLIDAIASMLMLEVTMIYATGDFEPMRTLVIISGICFMALAILISVIMMVRGIKGLRRNGPNDMAR